MVEDGLRLQWYYLPFPDLKEPLLYDIFAKYVVKNKAGDVSGRMRYDRVTKALAIVHILFPTNELKVKFLRSMGHRCFNGQRLFFANVANKNTVQQLVRHPPLVETHDHSVTCARRSQTRWSPACWRQSALPAR